MHVLLLLVLPVQVFPLLALQHLLLPVLPLLSHVGWWAGVRVEWLACPSLPAGRGSGSGPRTDSLVHGPVLQPEGMRERERGRGGEGEGEWDGE